MKPNEKGGAGYLGYEDKTFTIATSPDQWICTTINNPSSQPIPMNEPAQPAPVAAPVAAPPPPAAVASAPRPAAVFPEDTGDVDFGAPMIEAVPVETGLADPAVNTAVPDSAEAGGGRQFNAKPGRAYPIPR